MLIGKNPLGLAPEWFINNIEYPSEQLSIDSSGVKINVRTWGSSEKKCLLFLHGFNAHTHWWDHVIPEFANDSFVVAMDFSGMGDSEHREAYSQETYADEVKDVIEGLKLDKPIIVAHSMGGHVSMIFGNKYKDLCDEIILVDSTIVLPPEKAKEMSSRRPTVRLGVASPTKEDAIERFRLMPPQPCELDFVLKYVAETSYRETEEGWKLKSDPTIMKTYSYLDQHENLTNLNCKLSLIYGQLSQLMTQETLDYFKYVSGLSDDRLHMIPGAMHHLFLDKPKEFVDALKQVLAS